MNKTAKLVYHYGNNPEEEMGTLVLEGNVLKMDIKDKSMKETLSRIPFDIKADGAEAYKFIAGYFSRSSTIMFREEKEKK